MQGALWMFDTDLKASPIIPHVLSWQALSSKEGQDRNGEKDNEGAKVDDTKSDSDDDSEAESHQAAGKEGNEDGTASAGDATWPPMLDGDWGLSPTLT